MPLRPEVPAVVIPGLFGFALEAEEFSPELTPAQLLQSLWLSLAEGRADAPASYAVALPEEPMLVGETPPDTTLEAIAAALPAHVEAGKLLHFIYDWRQDLCWSAARLAEELERLRAAGGGQVDLIAHGPGALVARYLVESGQFPSAQAVRRLVILGGPGAGVPAGVMLLSGVLAVFGSDGGLVDVMDGFPAAVQLLPPAEAGWIAPEGQPGVRLDLFGEPLALGAGTMADEAGGGAVSKEVLARAQALHLALHGRLSREPHPLQERSLHLASAAHSTYGGLQLRCGASGGEWIDSVQLPGSGDGIVPIQSALFGLRGRSRLVSSAHLGLPADPTVQAILGEFLLGPVK